ncbi:MAG: ABC transporter permease [Clostridiales Family XIII bacterium]|jgi:ABC-2 type transport system permease protein|nr:ABC transporter permease [Clostridiales Family XIII bacterium]
MKKILTVLAFEYKGFTGSKTFRTVTIILAALLLIACFLPQIIAGFKSVGVGADMPERTKGVVLLGGDAAADPSVAALFTPDALAQAAAGVAWTDGAGEGLTEADLKARVEDDTYNIALYYEGGTGFDFIAKGNSMFNYSYIDFLSAIVKQAAQQAAIEGLPQDAQEEAAEIAAMEAVPNVVAIGGDAESNYWVGYLIMMLLFYMIMMYGQFVSTSVVTEKTSKAMELLITAARPIDLMVGKVVGVGLAGLTQFAALVCAAAVGIALNMPYWKRSGSVFYDLFASSNLSGGLVAFLLVFFFLGFFLYAFFLAALSSTVSRQEEAATIITLPMLLLSAALGLGFLTLLGILPKAVAAVVSYVPFFTPWVMISRFTVGDATPLGAAIGAVVLAAGMALIAWLAAKIYRVGVMMYGTRPSLKQIFKLLKRA